MKSCASAFLAASTISLSARRAARRRCFAHAGVEEVDVLADEGDLAAPGSRLELAKRPAVRRDCPLGRVVEAKHQFHDRGLSHRPTARRTQSFCPTGIVKLTRRSAPVVARRIVAERHAVEHDVAYRGYLGVHRSRSDNTPCRRPRPARYLFHRRGQRGRGARAMGSSP